MKVTSLKIPDVKLIEPDVFEDERGFFYESFNQQKFNEAIGQDVMFVQDNHSKSSKGVLRGLHYQEAPFAQGKLVRVVVGELFDVAVDIRKGSPTYGQWVSEILSEKNKKQLNQLNFDDVKLIRKDLDKNVMRVFEVKNSVNLKTSYGGTSIKNIKRMISKLKKEFK